GNFKSINDMSIETDTLLSTGLVKSFSVRNSDSERNFQNIGGTLSYKHIYPREGKEWTADINYNGSTSDNKGNFQTQNYDSNHNPSGSPVLQKQVGDGTVDFTTFQTDYVDPLTDKIKI